MLAVLIGILVLLVLIFAVLCSIDLTLDKIVDKFDLKLIAVTRTINIEKGETLVMEFASQSTIDLAKRPE